MLAAGFCSLHAVSCSQCLDLIDLATTVLRIVTGAHTIMSSSSSSSGSYEGACACGAVSYTIDEDLSEASICHCKTCQAWSGGVFVYVQSKKVEVKNQANVSVWKSSEWGERGFCKTCGSNVYCRITAPGPMEGQYHIGAGTLKDWKGIKLTSQIFIDRKPDGYEFTADGKKMTADDIYALWGAS